MSGQAELFGVEGQKGRGAGVLPPGSTRKASARVTLESFACPLCKEPVAGRRRRLLRCKWCGARFCVVSGPEGRA